MNGRTGRCWCVFEETSKLINTQINTGRVCWVWMFHSLTRLVKTDILRYSFSRWADQSTCREGAFGAEKAVKWDNASVCVCVYVGGGGVTGQWRRSTLSATLVRLWRLAAVRAFASLITIKLFIRLISQAESDPDGGEGAAGADAMGLGWQKVKGRSPWKQE